jgi:hypothetical protein
MEERFGEVATVNGIKANRNGRKASSCRSFAEKMNASKINVKCDAECDPEEILGMHSFGFFVAHAKRRAMVQLNFDKQWNDDVRLRPRKYGKVKNKLDPVKRPKDGHILERVLHERDEERYSVRASLQSSDSKDAAVTVIKRQPLPRESDAFLKSPRYPVYYCAFPSVRWLM